MTRARSAWEAISIGGAVALLLGACQSSLPSVSDDIIDSIEGTQVTIVSRHDGANPSDEWIETNVVVEVSGPEPRIDAVEDVLRAGGWEVGDAKPSDVLLLIARRPTARLNVLELNAYLSITLTGPVVEQFAKIEGDPDRSYFVVGFMPLSN